MIMKKPWHILDPVLYKNMKDRIGAAYPTLHFFERDGQVFLKGTYSVLYESQVLDRYKIEIELQKDYPRSLPIVWEIGGRIPRVPDRHVSRLDGSLCTCLPDAQWLDDPEGVTLERFLDGPLRNYLLFNSSLERGEEWPHGEWDHGANGILDHYAKYFGTKDLFVVLNYLDALAKPQIKGHGECPCGSGKRLRHCHVDVLLKMHGRIPTPVLEFSMAQLKDAIEKQSCSRA